MSVEPLTTAEGEQYVGRRVAKYFPPNPAQNFGGGTFHGTVVTAENDIKDAAPGWWFQIKYDDDDEEHIQWPELLTVLLKDSSHPPSRRGDGEQGAGAGRQAAGRNAKRSRRDDDDGNDQGDAAGGEDEEEEEEEEEDYQPKQRRQRRHDHHHPQDQEQQQQQQQQEGGDGQHAEGEEPPADGGPLVVRTRGLAGHLHSIKAQNFMCHENFYMEFGLHVNVVSGQNGSGKSAVMQALQCCLGATARSTGRAASLTSFVKTGASEACVQVTLWNTGEDAFQAATYGERITVERKISAKSGGGFRLLDARGRKVTGRREDLQALLDHLGVNAANPLTVMTQDCSRDFLSGSVANRKKFDLFMEATMLQDIELQLQRADALLAELRGILQDAHNEHHQRKAQAHELEKRVKQLERVASMAQMRGAYQDAMSWAVAQDSARHVEESRAELEKLRGQVAAAEAAAKEAAVAVEALKEQERTLREELERETAKTRDATANLKGLKEAALRARRTVTEHSQCVKKLEDDLAGARASQEELLEALKVNKAEVAERKRREMEAYESQLNNISETLRQSQAEFAECKHEHQRRREEVKDRRAGLERLRDQYNFGTQDLDRLQRNLEALQAAKQNRAAVFGGQRVLSLMADVAAHRGFHRPPIGPIGAFLNLRRPECAVALEAAIGSILEAWVCHDREDARLLRQVASRHGLHRLTVITADFDIPMHHVPVNRQPQGHLNTVLKLLQVQECASRHTLVNVLIDQASAEATVVAGQEGGRELAYSRPQNVRGIYELDGTQCKASRGSVTIIPFNSRRQARLGTDAGTQLEDTQQRVMELQASLADLRSQMEAEDTQIRQLNTQVDDAHKAMLVAARTKQSAEARMSQLSSQRPEGAEEGLGDEDEEQRQLDEATREVQQLEAALVAARQHVAEAERASAVAVQLFNDARDLARGTTSGFNQLKEQIQDVGLQVLGRKKEQEAHQQQAQASREKEQQQEAELAQKQRQDERVRAQLAAMNVDLAALQPAVDTVTRAERKHAERAAKRAAENAFKREGVQWTPQQVEQEAEALLRKFLTSEVIEKRLQQVNRDIEELQRDNGGSLEEVQAELLALRPEVERRKKTLDAMTALYNGLRERVRKRRDTFSGLFITVKESVNSKFNSYMARRRHKGWMEIKGPEKELKLEVRIGGLDNKKAKAVTDLKTLSGGERSFTTVAFLLALGEWTESPFRCMDEFDVFMDAVNRRIATETLLEFALEKSEMQYIFLTPQDLQAVEDAKRQLETRKKVQLPDGFLKVVQIRPARPR